MTLGLPIGWRGVHLSLAADNKLARNPNSPTGLPFSHQWWKIVRGRAYRAFFNPKKTYESLAPRVHFGAVCRGQRGARPAWRGRWPRAGGRVRARVLGQLHRYGRG